MPSLHAVPVTEGLLRFKMWYFCFLDSMDTGIITLPPPPLVPSPRGLLFFRLLSISIGCCLETALHSFITAFPRTLLSVCSLNWGPGGEKCDLLYRGVFFFFFFVQLQQCVVSMENGREIWSLGAAWMLYPYVSGPSETKAGLRSTASSALVLLVQTLLVCSCKEHTQD